MKALRIWAQVRGLFLVIMVMAGFTLGPSVAHAADAPLQASLVFPSSSAPGTFSPWKKMHPSTFDLSIEAVEYQCKRAEPTETWLTPKHCTLLTEMLEAKQCPEVFVPDGVRLDRLLGRVNGGKGKSQPWAKQDKQTGRLDRALLCDLGDGVYSYWFTGDKGKSCNNVAFTYSPPPPPKPAPPPPSIPVEVVPAPPPSPQGKWVCVNVPIGEVVPSVVGHQLEGFVVRDKCCCGNDLVVRSHNFHLGSTLQSEGYTEKCFWIEPNQP